MHPKIAVTALLLPALAYGTPVKAGKAAKVKCPTVTAPTLPSPKAADCNAALSEALGLGSLLKTSGSVTVGTCTVSYVTNLLGTLESILNNVLGTAVSAIESTCKTLDGTYIPVPGVSISVSGSASA